MTLNYILEIVLLEQVWAVHGSAGRDACMLLPEKCMWAVGWMSKHRTIRSSTTQPVGLFGVKDWPYTCSCPTHGGSWQTVTMG